MPITALYAGLLTPLFILLAIRVVQARHGARVGVGDGGDPALLRRMRVQANFAEYVPMALLLMALAESLSTRGWLLHALGVALVLARIVHAAGMSQPRENFKLRTAGIATTFGVMIVAALACVAGALRS
jgi:uncharacterized membrane protein YecN with MAPEG domain